MKKLNYLKEYTLHIIKNDISYLVSTKFLYEYKDKYEFAYNYLKIKKRTGNTELLVEFARKFYEKKDLDEIDKIFILNDMDDFLQHHQDKIEALYLFHAYLKQIERKKRCDLLISLKYFVIKDCEDDFYKYFYDIYLKYYENCIFYYVYQIDYQKEEINSIEYFFDNIFLNRLINNHYKKEIYIDHLVEFSRAKKSYNEYLTYKGLKNVVYPKMNKIRKKYNAKKKKTFYWNEIKCQKETTPK